jgi:hypothetical protein
MSDRPAYCRPAPHDAATVPRKLRMLEGLMLTNEGDMRADMIAPRRNTLSVYHPKLLLSREINEG